MRGRRIRFVDASRVHPRRYGFDRENGAPHAQRVDVTRAWGRKTYITDITVVQRCCTRSTISSTEYSSSFIFDGSMNNVLFFSHRTILTGANRS
jgi:hypothetical protein